MADRELRLLSCTVLVKVTPVNYFRINCKYRDVPIVYIVQYTNILAVQIKFLKC